MEIDFLPFFSPIFQNLCHFMRLLNTKSFGCGLGGFGVRGVFSITFDFDGLGCRGCINQWNGAKHFQLIPGEGKSMQLQIFIVKECCSAEAAFDMTGIRDK